MHHVQQVRRFVLKIRRIRTKTLLGRILGFLDSTWIWTWRFHDHVQQVTKFVLEIRINPIESLGGRNLDFPDSIWIWTSLSHLLKPRIEGTNLGAHIKASPSRHAKWKFWSFAVLFSHGHLSARSCKPKTAW